MGSERARRSEPRSEARAGGVLVVEDFNGNLEAALRELKRESAPALSIARRRRSFTSKPTRSARKRRGIARGRRRAAEEARDS